MEKPFQSTNPSLKYITKVNCYALGLPKSHRNDAFVIAGSTIQQRTDNVYFGKFFRRQNRKLYKGAHSHIRNMLASAFGFKRGDKVRLADGSIGFIHRLRSSGYFDVCRLDGTVLHIDLARGIAMALLISAEGASRARGPRTRPRSRSRPPNSPSPWGGPATRACRRSSSPPRRPGPPRRCSGGA